MFPCKDYILADYDFNNKLFFINILQTRIKYLLLILKEENISFLMIKLFKVNLS